ncbi:Ionotropic receptor 744 [Blattella germanica]|nr:Ionotropic receptor 744 [Blattella germanica]
MVIFSYFLLCLLITTPVNAFMCVEEIISKYFSPGQSIVISVPSVSPDFKHRFLNSSITLSDNIIAISAFIRSINQKEDWPILISTDSYISYQEAPLTHLQDGYVIFLLSDEEEPDFTSILISQLNSLQSFDFSYNRNGKFIIVVCQHSNLDPLAISKNILKEMFDTDNIINAVVILPGGGHHLQHNAQLENSKQVYDIYSLFPFDSEYCARGDNVSIIGKCLYEGQFLKDRELFPQKVPLNLNNCKLIISLYPNEPYFILSQNYTVDNYTYYKFEGIEMVFLNYASEVMNFSYEFQILGGDNLYEIYSNGLIAIMAKKTNIIMGMFPLFPQLCAFADPTVPYIFTSSEWFVPCAKQNPTSGNILKVFDISVWLVTVVVLVFSSLVFLCLSKIKEKSKSYNNLSYCFLYIWAILISVSAEHIPVGTQFRMFVLLFVLFSFVLSTIFQSFFTAFLIEPTFEKQIKTFEDHNERGIKFASGEMIESLSVMVGTYFQDKINHVVNCPDYIPCMIEGLKYNNISFLGEKYSTLFMGSQLGLTASPGKTFCTLLTVGSGPVCMYFSKGHPILERINFLIRLCFESGFLGMYWSQLTTDKARQYTVQEENDEYTAFNLFHLYTSFLYLLFGYAISLSSFFFEVSFKHLRKVSAK